METATDQLGASHVTGPVIDVALVPSLLTNESTAHDPHALTAIVIDVVRATTTLCVLFENGCASVLVAPDIAGCRALRDEPSRASALLAGETGGLPPEGFDLGNSPAELAEHDLAGRDVIFATTNGTRALVAAMAAGAATVLAGTLRNASAVARAALDAWVRDKVPASAMRDHSRPTSQPRAETASESPGVTRPVDIVVVCSGRGGLPAYDDTLCAGFLVRALLAACARRGFAPDLREGARIALDVAHAAELPGRPLRDVLASTDAGRATRRVGLQADLDWCAAIDATTLVPEVVASQDGGPPLRITAREHPPRHERERPAQQPRRE